MKQLSSITSRDSVFGDHGSYHCGILGSHSLHFRELYRLVFVLCACVWVSVGAGNAEITQNVDEAVVIQPDVPHAYLKAVEAAAKGAEVLAVEYPPSMGREHPVKSLPSGATLLDRLQSVAEAYSIPDFELKPLPQRGLWVMAPARKEVLNLDLWEVTPMDVMSPRVALEMFLMSLTAKQMAGVGTDAGLQVSRFSAAQRALISHALTPPLRIAEKKMQTKVFPNGYRREMPVDEPRGEITTTMDLSSVSIRGRLRMEAPMLNWSGQDFTVIAHRHPPLGLEVQGDVQKLTALSGGASLPALKSAPNTLKPSDIIGTAYPTPIGVDGQQSVHALLDRIGKLTGLHLRSAYGYADLTVFIGSADTSCGDVLDGIALALTATWRRLGSEYILCWDRTGLGALQQSAMEVTAAAVGHVSAQRDQNYRNRNWDILANTAPIAENSLIMLTPEQRARMFEPGRDVSADRRLHFGDMTADQQEVIRSVYHEMGLQSSPNSDFHFITEEDLSGVYVPAEACIELSLSLPGYGWTRLPFMLPGDIDGESLERYRRERLAASESGGARSDEGKGAASQIVFPLDTSDRAIMVPALGPSRMVEIVKSMERHGLNTLFYPVFSEGYTTFPTSSFPLNPTLRGKDPWPALGQAARAANIRLVGYVASLSWQPLGARVHWMTKHPSWVDVDMLGRTPAKWWEDNPDGQLAGWEVGTVVSNYVRPAEPAVQSRLVQLVRDFAGTKYAVSLAFADWDAAPGPGLGTHTRPPLGYTTADRRAVIERNGRDPVDDANPRGFTSSLLRRTGAVYAPPTEKDAPPPAGQALVAHLLEIAKIERKDWTTYLLNDGTLPYRNPTKSKSDGIPKPDVEAELVLYLDRPMPSYAMLRAWPGALYGSMLLPSPQRYLPPMEWISTALTTAAKAATPPKLILLDFRGAPEELAPFFRTVELRRAVGPEPVNTPRHADIVPSTGAQ